MLRDDIINNKDFIINNYQKLSWKQIKEKLNLKVHPKYLGREAIKVLNLKKVSNFHLTEEQKKYILDNYQTLSWSQMQRHLGLNYTIPVFKNMCCKLLNIKTEKIVFNEKQKEIIIENHKNKTWDELYDLVKPNCNKDLFRFACYEFLDKNNNSKIRKEFNYTDEHYNFILENKDKYNLEDLHKEFQKKFDVNVNFKQFHGYFYRNKLKKGYKFLSTPHVKQRKPIGTTYYDYKNGYVIKIGNEGSKRERWIMLKNYIWEQKYGKIPKGYRVIYKDGNNKNCCIENLVLLSTSAISQMNLNSMFKKGKCTEAYIEVMKTWDTINETIKKVE